MWLNGEFCYKDGKMVKMPFDLDRVDPAEKEKDSGDDSSFSGPDQCCFWELSWEVKSDFSSR